MKKKSCPDGGYGWIIAISTGLVSGLSAGIFKCTGQIYVSMLQNTEYTRSQLATSLILPRVLGALLAIFANKLAEMYSFKFTLFLGSGLLGLGMCLSSLAFNDIGVFNLTFGVIIGTGFGLTLTPCTIVTGLYFTKRRPLAISVMLTLAGTNSFLLPILVQWLLDAYFLQGGLLLFGGILLQGCVAAMLIRQPVWALQTPIASNQDSENDASNGCGRMKLFLTKLRMDCRHFGNFIFVLLLFNRIAFMFVNVSVFLIVPQFAVEQIAGISSAQCAYLLSVICVGDVICRWLAGCVNNFAPNHKTALFLISLVAMAISALSFQFATSYYSMLAVSVIYGLFNGYVLVAYFLVMFDYFGPAATPGANAIHYTITGLCLLAVGPVMGRIRDLTGSYKDCFIFLAAFQQLTVLMWLYKPLVSQYKRKNNNIEELETNT